MEEKIECFSGFHGGSVGDGERFCDLLKFCSVGFNSFVEECDGRS